MRARTVIAAAAGAALIAGLWATGPAAAGAPAARTPATGSLQLSFSPSTFTSLQKAGLSLYAYADVRVGLGDNGGVGAGWPVNAVDGSSVYTDPESGALVWLNGPAGRRVDFVSPSFITKDGKTGVVKAKVYANGASLGTVTLFDVAGGKQKLTLHKGVDRMLDRALSTTVFSPGMAVGNVDFSATPTG
jgi:hypothetical protein